MILEPLPEIARNAFRGLAESKQFIETHNLVRAFLFRHNSLYAGCRFDSLSRHLTSEPLRLEWRTTVRSRPSVAWRD